MDPDGSVCRRRALVASVLARAAVDVGRLVLPVACAGCGELDVLVCSTCRALLGGPRRCEADAGRLDRLDGRPVLPVWTLAAYTGPVRELVVAWKDRGRTDLARPFASAAAHGAQVLAPVIASALAQSHLVGSDRGGLLVVPVPSTAAARRRRGTDPVGGLAVAVARGCAAVSVPASARPVLRRRGRSRDQVGLGARARGGNLEGRVRVRSAQVRGLRGRAVLLVDDILTTGATLAACERALAEAGAVVVGALTLAATPPPGHPGGVLVPVAGQV